MSTINNQIRTRFGKTKRISDFVKNHKMDWTSNQRTWEGAKEFRKKRKKLMIFVFGAGLIIRRSIETPWQHKHRHYRII